MANYPPEPWHLLGRMYLSFWLVPRTRLPALPVAPVAVGGPAPPIEIAGRVVVGTAWVWYAPGGVLHYRELLAAVLVRVNGRPAVSIINIWVDSEPSRDGGRELWGIPKELAEFTITEEPGLFGRSPVVLAASAGGKTLAHARFTPRWRHPFRWPFRFSVAQVFPIPVATPGQPSGTGTPPGTSAAPGASPPPVPGAAGTQVMPQLRITPVRGDTALRHALVEWTFPPDGPLGYLAGRRPWLSHCLTDFQLTFGEENRANGHG